MAGSQTLRFDVIGDASSAARAFRQTAEGAALASRGAKQLSESLTLQSKSAQVSALATVSLAKSDDILRDAELELSGAADEARRQLQQQGRAAEEAAAKTRAAGDAAKGAGPGFGVLATPMGAAVAAGVALAPVLVTVGTGLGGVAAAAYGTVSPILAAGTATKQAQQALAGLDPAQRAAYDSLGKLKTQFSGFSKSLEPEVLSLFSQGLGMAGGALRDVQPVAAATGKALGSVLGQVDAEFKSQNWQQFFGFMAQTAGPDVQQLGGLVVDLTNDLPPLLEALQPVASGFLMLADDTAKAAGAVEAFAGPVSSNAEVVAKANQSNKGFFGSLVGYLDKLKLWESQGLGVKQSTEAAAASTRGLGAATGTAAPQVGTLAGDMALLNTSATDAGTALSAYSDAWAKIVGNSLSDQQAVLADESAFASLTTAVKKSGGQSLQARQAFVSYMQQIGTSISTLEQNGASVGAVNAEYETNIRRLQGLHGLNATQRSDIAGLVRDYGTWANSTAGLDKQTATAAQTLKDNFTSGLKAAGDLLPRTSADVSNLANAVLKTGTTSSVTRGDRAALIRDLEKAGIDAGTATTMVDGLQRRISGLHGKTVKVGADTSTAVAAVQSFSQMVASLHGKTVTIGTQVIGGSQLVTGLLNGMGHAAGGRITAGTTPTADDVLVRVSRGETVVSAAHSRVLAPAFAEVGVPGYASGGVPVLGRAVPVGGGPAGGDVHYHITVNVPPTVNPREAGRQVADLLLAHTRSGGRLYPPGTTPR